MMTTTKLLQLLNSVQTEAQFAEIKCVFQQQHAEVIDESKIVSKVLDYSRYQALFLLELLLDSKYTAFSTFQGYRQFFKTLNAIKPKDLSDDEKSCVLRAIYQCYDHKQLSVVESALDCLIKQAVLLKSSVGIDAFGHLFSEKALVRNKSALLTVEAFSRCIGLWLKYPEFNPLICLDLDGITRLLSALASQAKPALVAEKSLEDTVADFSKKTQMVQYPLKTDEIDCIARDYQQIKTVMSAGAKLSQAEIIQKLQTSVASKRDNRTEHLGLIALLIPSVFGITPNSTQLFVVVGLLYAPEGRLAQMKTGEGKSTVITMLAMYAALQGRPVHIITSAHHLAIRDQAKYAAFFKLLGLDSTHCDQRRETPFHEHIIYGTAADFQFCVLYDSFKVLKKQQLPFKNVVALVDEIDSLFLDSSSHGARIAMPHPHPQSWLLELIFNYVKEKGRSFEVTAIAIRQARDAFNALEDGRYQAQLSTIKDDFLAMRLHSAKRALYSLTLNQDYTLEKANTEVAIVDRGLTDEIHEGMRWKAGLHEFLEMKHGIAPKAETLTLATISNPDFFTFYDCLMAVTGTLGGLSERDEVKKMYGLDSFDAPPHRPSLRQMLPNQICDSQYKHTQAILEEVKQFHALGRPVLILCDTIESAQVLFDSLVIWSTSFRTHCQLLNEKQAADKEWIVHRMGHAKTITCATRVAARGTDVQLTEESRKSGGLHVISSVFAQNTRVEEQGFGRVARQGDPGTCRRILCWDDPFIQKLMPKDVKRKSFADAAAAVDFLVARRDEYAEFVSKQRLYLTRQANSQYSRFKQCCDQFQYLLAVVEALPFESINQSCQKLTSGVIAREIPTLFEPLCNAAQQLMGQQKAGGRVNWLPFLNQVSQTLQTHLKMQWGFFLEQTEEGSDVDFDLWLQVTIIPWTSDPQRSFMEVLTAVLQVPIDTISMDVSKIKLPEKPAWQPRFFPATQPDARSTTVTKAGNDAVLIEDGEESECQIA